MMSTVYENDFNIKQKQNNIDNFPILEILFDKHVYYDWENVLSSL